MTEQDWLECADPEKMLSFLNGKGSERKLRLFACACCRRVWHLLTDESSRRAVEVGECFADGLATHKELAQARAEVRSAGWSAIAARARQASWSGSSFIAWCTTRPTIAAAARAAARSSAWQATATPTTIAGYRGWIMGDLAGEKAKQTDLLRCIFGNPFRSAQVDPEWLCWRDRAAIRIGRTIYDERRFQDLPILADALEEAGCTSRAVLGHCREPGEHARGCWVVDSVLSKE